MRSKEKNIISHLLRNRFDNLTADELATSAPDLIYTARSLGLEELASEMQSDLHYSLPRNLKRVSMATSL